MDVQGFLDRVRGQSWYDGQVVDDRTLPARDAVERDPETPLHPALVARLEELGRWPLYAHQAEAIDAVAGGRECRRRDARRQREEPLLPGALCWTSGWRTGRRGHCSSIPTKALAQDQLTALKELAPSRPAPVIAAYDGDTPYRRTRGHPPLGPRAADQPGHAARGHPAQPQGLGGLLPEPPHRRHRRGACIPGRLRLARLAAAAAAAAGVRPATAPSRDSSSARPPSATRRSWPRT